MRTRKTTAVIVLIYNILGIIAILGLYPADPFYWDGSVFILLFTFPITIISSGLRYFDSSITLPLIVQSVMLISTLLITDSFTKWIIKKRK